jgi:prolipoprotein diacylglyceryltransferase
MQFFILVLLVCLFVFLYCVYVLSNDDFIFLRRDVTMEKLFNIIFIGALASLFFSRLFYGFSAKNILSNPFVFMLFPYFPGLSLLGGVVGAGAYFLFLMRRQENLLPLGRIYDFFSIAFLISLPIGFIGYSLFLGKGMEIKLGVEAILYFSLFIVFLKFFLPRLLNGKLKEGTIAYLFLICFSVISLISNAFSKINILGYFKNFENIALILIFLSLLVMLARHESLLLKIKQLKKGKA